MCISSAPTPEPQLPPAPKAEREKGKKSTGELEKKQAHRGLLSRLSTRLVFHDQYMTWITLQAE